MMIEDERLIVCAQVCCVSWYRSFFVVPVTAQKKDGKGGLRTPLHKFAGCYFQGVGGSEVADGIVLQDVEMAGVVQIFRDGPQVFGRGQPLFVIAEEAERRRIASKGFCAVVQKVFVKVG